MSINTSGTLNLARQAAAAGVRRFVFLSSVKVHGDSGTFTELSPLMPTDAYGTSKMEAERGLRRVADETGMEVVVVRPPLVYGPGVRANFLSLMRAISRGYPLPLGGINNYRSLVALDNLVDFILQTTTHHRAANEAFLVSDDCDLSTTELVSHCQRDGASCKTDRIPSSVLMGWPHSVASEQRPAV